MGGWTCALLHKNEKAQLPLLITCMKCTQINKQLEEKTLKKALWLFPVIATVIAKTRRMKHGGVIWDPVWITYFKGYMLGFTFPSIKSSKKSSVDCKVYVLTIHLRQHNLPLLFGTTQTHISSQCWRRLGRKQQNWTNTARTLAWIFTWWLFS